MKKVIEITIGIILVIIGIAGGVIPIFQGWIFGIPGLFLLSKHFPPIKKFLNWAKSKINKN